MAPPARSHVLRSFLLATAAFSLACQSHRALPLGAPPPGLSNLSPRLEATRFHLLTSVRDDVAVERIFAGPGLLLVTSPAPEPGVFGSTDGGLVWSFSPLDAADAPDEGRRPPSNGGPARVLREVLFDSGGRAFGLRGGHLFCSEPQAQAWRGCNPEGASIEALVLSADGVLLAAGGGALFVSPDGGGSWAKRPVRVPGLAEDVRPHFRGLVADPHDARTFYLALRSDHPDAGASIAGLIDGSSDAAYAARSFASDPTPLPRATSFGQGVAAVLVTHDAGASWRRSGLALDAWLSESGGALWAVTADPLLEAAGLLGRSPDLALALGQQLRQLRVETGPLRAALAWPGRQRLLAGTPGVAPVFKSVDGGATWARVLELPPQTALTLRIALERQRAALEGLPDFANAGVRRSGGRGEGGRGGPGGEGGGGGMGPGGGGGRGGRGGGRMGGGRGAGARSAAPVAGPAARFLAAEALLAYLDPARLLARFNDGRPLSGVARAEGGGLVAWAPTEAYWNKLADAAIAASDAEGEISLGPGAPPRDPTLPPFEVLLSADGAAWTALAEGATLSGNGAPGPGGTAPYPEQVAATASQELVVLSARDRTGRGSRQAWRRVR